MTLTEELENYVKDTFSNTWTRRRGQQVPEADSVGLKNEGVDLDAVVLYADLADSTGLVKSSSSAFAAEVYKSYLYVAAKIIIHKGGVITAYDGDRIMAVYIGNSKNSNAAATALHINWAVTKLIQPALETQYPKSAFKIKQKVGIDASQLMVARTGIRGHNDLVWVGNAANNAAKLAGRSTNYPSYISHAVFDRLAKWPKCSRDLNKPMWTDLGVGEEGFRVYGSSWWSSL